tara:strand:- start:274 stop:600 length:327 start_codon:yes stop_codon:yes gene_type:complete
MDNISLFLDHYVIYDIKRNSFILNTNSGSQFEKALRDLITQEIKNTLLERVKSLDYEIKLTEPHRNVSPQHSKLVNDRSALMNFHNELLWGEEQVKQYDKDKEILEAL